VLLARTGLTTNPRHHKRIAKFAKLF
jgi:hypothetical protein